MLPFITQITVANKSQVLAFIRGSNNILQLKKKALGAHLIHNENGVPKKLTYEDVAYLFRKKLANQLYKVLYSSAS